MGAQNIRAFSMLNSCSSDTTCPAAICGLGPCTANGDADILETKYTYIYKQNKLRGLTPRANHTGRATAACRRS
jgi:hypothetical protein